MIWWIVKKMCAIYYLRRDLVEQCFLVGSTTGTVVSVRRSISEVVGEMETTLRRNENVNSDVDVRNFVFT